MSLCFGFHLFSSLERKADNDVCKYFFIVERRLRFLETGGLYVSFYLLLSSPERSGTSAALTFSIKVLYPPL